MCLDCFLLMIWADTAAVSLLGLVLIWADTACRVPTLPRNRSSPFMVGMNYCSLYRSWSTVCPTAFSTFLSMFSGVSFTVCHVGPKLLGP